ncbi:hypothetical protein T03_5328 [Trichinella britovi]|uniref:Uncharacterized protein n=1 Tax=Trichinella britovi TaxID=45882 RepID=A0A0V1C7P8_TRIBR|nr:hypothetical protein T03_5328 [Trichinella britovi]
MLNLSNGLHGLFEDRDEMELPKDIADYTVIYCSVLLQKKSQIVLPRFNELLDQVSGVMYFCTTFKVKNSEVYSMIDKMI